MNQSIIKDFRSFVQTFSKKSFRNKNRIFFIIKYESFKYYGNKIIISEDHNLASLPETFIAIGKIPNPFDWSSRKLYSKFRYTL